MEDAADDLISGPGRRHFTRRPVQDGGWAFVLASRPAEVLADREFIAALGGAGASARWLRIRIEGTFLPQNRETTDVIEAYLADAGEA